MAASSSDELGVEHAFRSAAPAIAAYCRRRLGNGHDAADAVQETFLKAWQRIDQLERPGSMDAWLRAIARNVCTDVERQRARLRPVDVAEVAHVDVWRDDVDAEPLLDPVVLDAAIRRLTPRHRTIIELREISGLTYEQIAQRERLNVASVKSVLWRARSALRREYALVAAAALQVWLAFVVRVPRVLRRAGATASRVATSDGGVDRVMTAGPTSVAAVAVGAVTWVASVTGAPAAAASIVVPPPHSATVVAAAAALAEDETAPVAPVVKQKSVVVESVEVVVAEARPAEDVVVDRSRRRDADPVEVALEDEAPTSSVHAAPAVAEEPEGEPDPLVAATADPEAEPEVVVVDDPEVVAPEPAVEHGRHRGHEPVVRADDPVPPVEDAPGNRDHEDHGPPATPPGHVDEPVDDAPGNRDHEDHGPPATPPGQVDERVDDAPGNRVDEAHPPPGRDDPPPAPAPPADPPGHDHEPQTGRHASVVSD
jgi:RNA polymerase sigma-70 factor (ECF subfamily)